MGSVAGRASLAGRKERASIASSFASSYVTSAHVRPGKTSFSGMNAAPAAKLSDVSQKNSDGLEEGGPVKDMSAIGLSNGMLHFSNPDKKNRYDTFRSKKYS